MSKGHYMIRSLKTTATLLLATLIGGALFGPAAQAATYTLLLPQFIYRGVEGGISPIQTVGTFKPYLTAGEHFVSARLWGTYGNAIGPRSAPVQLFGDGVLLGQCEAFAPCTTDPYVDFSYDIKNLEAFLDGSYVLQALQTGGGVTLLSILRLEITTAEGPLPAVPLPMSAALLLGPLGALVALGRRRRSR